MVTEMVDGKLILQIDEDGIDGVPDGLAWIVAIFGETGRMVVTTLINNSNNHTNGRGQQ